VLAESNTPGYALNSVWVYRLEVGGAFFVGVYALFLVFWLAYHGRSVQKAQLPGGLGVDVGDPNLDQAAEGLTAYKEKTDERLARLEASVELLASDEDRRT
jgi:hypothetical protein